MSHEGKCVAAHPESSTPNVGVGRIFSGGGANEVKFNFSLSKLRKLLLLRM